MATKTTKPAFFFDADQLIAVQQRNVDAMTSAGQVMVEGYKAFALRQSEMFQTSFGDMVADGQKVVDGKTGEFKPADQITRVKSGYETALANAQELTDIAVKAQNEAFGILAKALMANFDDFKSLAKAA
jgi:phasin family protein